MSTVSDKDVGWLDVAVDDPLDMRGIECIGDLDAERKNQFGVQRSPSNAVLKRHAV